jgi:SOS-response transcriptional repressor LexA
MDSPNYYSILPADVRYDKDLSSLEKLLYSEITALANKSGYCWASNNYFAKLYDKNDKYISGLINNLKRLGYIKVEIEKENGNVRKIWVVTQKHVPPYPEKPE